MYNEPKHIAYNIITGDVIMTACGNHLKRYIARTDRWNIATGYDKGKWRFVHGTNCEQKMAKKLGGDR